MLIRALCDYYDFSSQNEGYDPDLFSEQDVSFLIALKPNGEVSDIIDIRQERQVPSGKKTKTVLEKVKIVLPKRSQKSGIDLNIIEHRPLYIFGLNYDNKSGTFTPYDRTSKAEKSHKLFVEGNLKFCEGLDSDIVNAYRSFLEKWIPENETENPELLKIAKLYSNSYFCFALDGKLSTVLHEDKALIDKYIAQKKRELDENKGEVISICPIEGEMLPVSRIHDKIKGVRGGNSVGSVLVGVKNSAFESYGKTQSYNSSISEKAMKKYTLSLNSLLNNERRRAFIDELTLVYFAIDKSEDKACDIFSQLMGFNDRGTLDENLFSIINNISQGKVGDLSVLDVNEKLMFYVVGLAPNSSRISQKFIVKNEFGFIMKNLIQHQIDMKIKKDSGQIPFWKITRELVAPNSTTDKVPPPLLSNLILSIFNGALYPTALLDIIIRRIKTDSDTDKNSFVKLNDVRVGIIRAYLNRKSRILYSKEEISMALDETNINQAYLCGRLFAVLEYTQKSSVSGTLNKTIKDSYFRSACVKPATVFPKLLMLAQNHLAKIENPLFLNKLITEISSKINGEFPQTLSLDEQGKFIIGYYHQTNFLYTKREK